MRVLARGALREMPQKQARREGQTPNPLVGICFLFPKPKAPNIMRYTPWGANLAPIALGHALLSNLLRPRTKSEQRAAEGTRIPGN